MDKEEKYPLQILLLEDDEYLNKEYKNKIEGIELDSFKVNVEAFEIYESALEFLKANSVDMVVTDNSINGINGGKELIDYLINEDFYPSMIFYSQAEIKNPDKLRKKGITVLPNVKQEVLINNIKKQLKLNSKRFESQTFIRGIFITKFVDLELQINDFLCKYFLNGKDKDKKRLFNDYLLESKYNSFENKSEVLCEMVSSKYEKYKEKISRRKLTNLATKRNKIAHSPFKDKAFTTHGNREEEITENEIRAGLREITKIKSAIAELAKTIEESPKDKE